MRNYIKIFLYLYVLIGFNCCIAGSYDDFFRAVKSDDAAVIVRLISAGFDANTPYENGEYGLGMAIREPSPHVVAALLSWPKLNVEVRNPHDESPLMFAALSGQTDVARQLIARGADINKPGWTPLHYAATNGHTDIMQMLLDGYAYIDASAPNGSTPLMMAAEYGTIQAVQLLLDAGADASIKNMLGQTALDFARRGSRPDAIELLTKLASKKP